MISERAIQKALFWRLTTSKDVLAPNCYALGWECDLLRITQGLTVHGYEIKLTRSDFLADFRKAGRAERKQPNFFWWVCPKDLIKPSEIPAGDGLIYISVPPVGGLSARLQVKATRRHKDKASDRLINEVYKSIYWRFWKQNEVNE